MRISGRSLAKVGLVTVLALAASALMIRVDSRGTVWLKFLLYAGSIGGAYGLTILSPMSCGWPLFRRQPKN